MQVSSSLTNGSATINGRGINRRKLSRHQRVRLAADVVTGTRPFRPSCEQASVLFGVPRYVLSRHLRGRRTRAAQHPEMAAGNGKPENGAGAAIMAALREAADAERGEAVRTIGELLLRMTPTDRIETARRVGVDWIWDHMIAPIVTEEGAETAVPAE